MFANDKKLLGRVKNLDDYLALQSVLDKMRKWSNTWQMKFNVNKCHVMECDIGEEQATLNPLII